MFEKHNWFNSGLYNNQELKHHLNQGIVHSLQKNISSNDFEYYEIDIAKKKQHHWYNYTHIFNDFDQCPISRLHLTSTPRIL